MERWEERYLELYGRDNTISDATLEAVERLPVIEGSRRDAKPAGAQQNYRQPADRKSTRAGWNPSRGHQECKGTTP